MEIRFINTGTSPNKGDGDTLRLAFSKINGNFQAIQPLIKSDKEIKELASSLLINGSNQGIAVSYNTASSVVNLSVTPASTSTVGGIKIGHNLRMDESAVLTAISSYTGLTPPSSPIEGDQWWDPQLGRGYVFYQGAWVEYSPSQDLILPLTDVPSSSTASGVFGQVALDESSLYVCVSTSTWKRITWDPSW